LRMNFGQDGSSGYMISTYGRAHELVRVELFNDHGIRVEWTEYAKGKTVTSQDPGETGSATHWESWLPAPARKGQPRVLHLVEDWDARAGKRRVLSRAEFDANQPCTVDEGKLAADDAVKKVIEGYNGQASCPANPEAAGFKVGGDTDKHEFKAAGPVCLDGTC